MAVQRGEAPIVKGAGDRRHAVSGAYEALDQRLRQGAYAAGDRLPAERALSEVLGVSRGTLRQALERLAGDGRLHRAPQAGWFVTDAVLSEPEHVLMSFTDMALQRGLTPLTSVLNSHTRSVTLEESERLRISPGSDVLALERLRSFGSAPICLDCSVIALDRCPGLGDVDLTDRSLYRTMEGLGAVPRRSDFAVQALPADEHQADALRIPVGTPVLVGQEVCFDERDAPLILGFSVFRGDSYRFKATLFR